MTQPRPSFAWIFPFLAPLLCIAVITTMTALNYINLRQTSVHGSGVSFHTHDYAFTVPRDKFLSTSFIAPAHVLSPAIQALNFPGMFGEVIASVVMRTWPDSYRPAALGPLPDDLFILRAASFPFFCIPFWWFAGLGMDALLKTRTLRWPSLLIGTLFWIVYLVIGIGMTCMFFAEKDKERSMIFIPIGFALWTAMMTAFPITWLRNIRQRRAKRHITTVTP